ncbi:MAG: hypothetical protein MIO93_06785 [ANME-2 cluster archaeon]|jgi:hypothetical protein|nr:hypothetical protein [ANME-2 cluster archaeon]
MSLTKSFLKNYLTTARSVITHPRKFYQDMPVSGSLKEPLNFAFMTILMVSILCAVIIISLALIFPSDDGWLLGVGSCYRNMAAGS